MNQTSCHYRCGVIPQARSKTCKHEPPKVNCDCRGKARSTDGGTTFSHVGPDPALLSPVCQATMVSVAAGAERKRRLFSQFVVGS